MWIVISLCLSGVMLCLCEFIFLRSSWYKGLGQVIESSESHIRRVVCLYILFFIEWMAYDWMCMLESIPIVYIFQIVLFLLFAVGTFTDVNFRNVPYTVMFLILCVGGVVAVLKNFKDRSLFLFDIVVVSLCLLMWFSGIGSKWVGGADLFALSALVLSCNEVLTVFVVFLLVNVIALIIMGIGAITKTSVFVTHDAGNKLGGVALMIPIALVYAYLPQIQDVLSRLAILQV